MAFGSGVCRWLFLEQESDVDQWSTEQNLSWCLAAADCVKSSKKLLEYEGAASEKVLILFRSGRLAETLPEQLRAELELESWRVWCHYGGNIATEGRDGPENRWKSWPGMKEADRELIRRANNNVAPYPYSKTQKTLPWLREIDRIKKLIRVASRPGMQQRWRLIVDLLEEAWEKADQATAFQTLLRTLTETLPAVLAGGLVRDVLSAGTLGNPLEAALQAVEVYRSSGFSKYRSAFPEHPTNEGVGRVKQCYESVLAACGELCYQTMGSMTEGRKVKDQSVALRRKLSEVHEQLVKFEESYALLSKMVTERMRRNPHAPGHAAPGE